MFRNNISVYCKNEEVAKRVRAYAQQLNIQAGGRAIVSAEEKCKHSLQSPKAQSISSPSTAIPELVLDIMNGGTFPAPEDLTREERALVYDGQLNGLINVYRISKRPETAEQIKSRLRDLGVDL